MIENKKHIKQLHSLGALSFLLILGFVTVSFSSEISEKENLETLEWVEHEGEEIDQKELRHSSIQRQKITFINTVMPARNISSFTYSIKLFILYEVLKIETLAFPKQ